MQGGYSKNCRIRRSNLNRLRAGQNSLMLNVRIFCQKNQVFKDYIVYLKGNRHRKNDRRRKTGFDIIILNFIHPGIIENHEKTIIQT
jgi:hypothetical protein